MKQIVSPLNLQLTTNAQDDVFKYAKVARTDTTATNAIGLPAYLIPIHVTLQSLGAASDAGTTATIQVIDAASSTVLATLDAKTAKTDIKVVDIQPLLALDVKDTWLQVKYAETGTASTTGGPWLIAVECMTVS